MPRRKKHPGQGAMAGIVTEEPNGHQETEASLPAEAELKVKGNADAVFGRAAKMARPEPEEEVELEVHPSDQDPTLGLLADPRNMVIVRRQFPTKWRGQRVNVEVARYRCPVADEDLRGDVFERFGGKQFLVSIHPATPTGESRILGAFPIENPDTDHPIFEEGMEPQVPFAPSVDPTMVEDTDPTSVAERAITQRTKLLQKKMAMRTAQQTLREMEEEEEDGRAKKRGVQPEATAVLELQRKFDDAQKASELGEVRQHLQSLSSAVLQVAQQPKPQEDTSKIFVSLINAMNQQSTAMMAAMQQNQSTVLGAIMQTMGRGRGGSDDFDSQLDRLAKMKQVFGGEDSRVRRIEDMIFNVFADRFEGGDSGDDEDTLKFAVKQGMPILKTLAEKYVDRESSPAAVLTKEEAKRYYEEAGKKAALAELEKLKSEGKLVKVQDQERAIGQAKEQAAQTQRGLPGPEPVPQPAGEEEEEDVNLPPSPQSPAYDRKKAVDFVLGVVIEDIRGGLPEKSYLIGDMLDRLDRELLDRLVDVTSGAELEELLRPHGDPAKLEWIKEAAGKDPLVKSWLQQVVTTVQNEYQKQLREAEKTR